MELLKMLNLALRLVYLIDRGLMVVGEGAI